MDFKINRYLYFYVIMNGSLLELLFMALKNNYSDFNHNFFLNYYLNLIWTNQINCKIFFRSIKKIKINKLLIPFPISFPIPFLISNHKQ